MNALMSVAIRRLKLTLSVVKRKICLWTPVRKSAVAAPTATATKLAGTKVRSATSGIPTK